MQTELDWCLGYGVHGPEIKVKHTKLTVLDRKVPKATVFGGHFLERDHLTSLIFGNTRRETAVKLDTEALKFWEKLISKLCVNLLYSSLGLL